MKNNTIFQLLIILILFFGTYFGLSQIDWVTLLQVERVSKATEEKLGDMFWDIFNQTEKEIKNGRIVKPIDSILTRLCETNKIERKDVKLHIVRNAEVNAFAMPNNHLVVFTGLITECENMEEFTGVLGHELGHMQKRHVMKKLIKELGVAAVISLTAGGGGEAIRQALSTLSSKAYDRRLEREADIVSVDYMVNAGINPKPFADFMERLADHESDLIDLTWMSTHPGSAERADYIRHYCKDKEDELYEEQVIAPQTWSSLKESLKD